MEMEGIKSVAELKDELKADIESTRAKVEMLEKHVELLDKFTKNQLQINDILRDLVLKKYTKTELDEFLKNKKEEESTQK